MSISLLRSSVGRTCFVFVCLVLVFPGIGRAQTEDESAKQIVAAGGLVIKRPLGKVRSIHLHIEKAQDLNHIDFSVFKNLKYIGILGGQPTDELLVRLQAIPPGVEILDFIIAPVTDDGLAGVLRKQKSLSYVALSATPITDKSLVELGKLEKLNVLYLNQTKITDQGLKSLAKLRLTHLNIRNTEISDAGLRELKGMTSLRYLFLEDTRVTDFGIQHLSGLQNLRLLGVDSTDVTENGKLVLKGALPNLQFYEQEKRPQLK